MVHNAFYKAFINCWMSFNSKAHSVTLRLSCTYGICRKLYHPSLSMNTSLTYPCSSCVKVGGVFVTVIVNSKVYNY